MMCNNAGGRLVKTMLVELDDDDSKSVTVGCEYDYVKIYDVDQIGIIDSRADYGVTYGQTLSVCNPSEEMILLYDHVTVSITDGIILFKTSNHRCVLHVEAYKYD